MIRQSTKRACLAPFYSEDGVFIVLFALMFTAFLAVLGIGVDAGNLFRYNRRLQNAVDAAAAAGAAHYAVNFQGIYNASDTNNGTAVEDGQRRNFGNGAATFAQQVVTKNLAIHGVTAEQITPTFYLSTDLNNPNPPPNPADRGKPALYVSATVRAPSYILKAVPGFAAFTRTQADATAIIQPSTVALVLDASGSMFCRASDNNCDCRYDQNIITHPFLPKGCCTGQNCGSGSPQRRKLDHLKDAVRNFVKRFDPAYDRISLTVFALGATTQLALQPGRGFSHVALNQAVTGIPEVMVPGGGTSVPSATNAGLAIDLAWTDLLSAQGGAGGQEIVQLSKSVVFFTDGAPNAGRFNFPSGQYYTWAVSWIAPALQNGAMSLVREDPAKWNPLHHVSPYYPGYNAANPAASDTSLLAPCTERNMGSLLNNWQLAFVNCMSSFDFLPTGKSNAADRIVYPGVAGANIDVFRQMFYDLAIAHADSIRSFGGTTATPRPNFVYAIGLGSPACGPAQCPNDPYQLRYNPLPGVVAFDDANRKDIFLRRVAKDRAGAYDPPFPVRLPLNTSDYSNAGLALGADTAEQLDRLFATVARRIKVLMTE